MKHRGCVRAGQAYETPFADCSKKDSECDPLTAEARVPLQQLHLSFPAAADVAQLHFVLRSEDATQWFKDGNSNFAVPVAPRREDDDAAGAVDSALVQVQLCFDMFSSSLIASCQAFIPCWHGRRGGRAEWQWQRHVLQHVTKRCRRNLVRLSCHQFDILAPVLCCPRTLASILVHRPRLADAIHNAFARHGTSLLLRDEMN